MYVIRERARSVEWRSKRLPLSRPTPSTTKLVEDFSANFLAEENSPTKDL